MRRPYPTGAFLDISITSFLQSKSLLPRGFRNLTAVRTSDAARSREREPSQQGPEADRPGW